MKTIAEYSFKMPTFLLSALINGDFSGLEDSDMPVYNKVISTQEELTKKHNCETAYAIWSETEENQEPYFTWSPDFINLGCDVIDYTLYIMGND